MLSASDRMRARSLLRRYWGATIVLGVFAGLAGGAALGVWGIARRTSTVYDRFVAYEDAATLLVFGCFEGITEEEIVSEGFQQACGQYDYADLRSFLKTAPEVEAAGRGTSAIGNVAHADRPEDGWRQLLPVVVDAEAASAVGRPIVVDGRLADPGVAAEVTINEEARDRLRVEVGDDLLVTPYLSEEFDLAGEGVAFPGGESTEVTVVGITRRPVDLVGRLGGTSIYEDSSAVAVGPGWWNQIDGNVAAYGVGVTVRPAPGSTNDDVVALIRERFPERLWEFETGALFGSGGQTVQDAIRLQAVGLFIIAAVVAVAAMLFAGQAVSRQARLEWSDAGILGALGMTRAGMLTAGAIRAVAVAAVAVIVALLAAVALSPLGPVGIGRAAEPHPGISVDGVVLAVGLPIVALSVVAFALVPIALLRTRSHVEPPSSSRSRTLSLLPPPAIAGWAMANSRRSGRLALGSAVGGVAFAAAAGVAALSLMSSYDELRADPARYGSTWDAQVGNVGDASQQADTRDRLSSIPGIEAVGIRSLDGIGANPDFVIVAGEPFLGDATFGKITAGRAPSAPTEIALGRTSMDEFDVAVGEQVTFTDPSDPSSTFSFDVVGEAVINDTLSDRPGTGGLMTSEAVDMLSPEALSQTYVVWVEEGSDREATLASLQQAFPTTYRETSTPRQVSNLSLVSGQPMGLALVIAVLAGAALIHALVMSVRGSRRQIGVLKSVGFTNRQVLATVAWHASLLSTAALVVGIPMGVVVGRVIWRAIVDNLGLVSAPALPVAAILAVAVVVLVVANLAAIGPGWAAARTRPASALRTE